MNQNNNSNLTANAQHLRREMTKEERHLWYDFLKHLPFKFNRQKVIKKYIVDFYCAEASLVIEIDGMQHFEDSGQYSDKIRDAFLNSLGLKVLRYSNYDMNTNFEGVCSDIQKHLPCKNDNAKQPPL